MQMHKVKQQKEIESHQVLESQKSPFLSDNPPHAYSTMNGQGKVSPYQPKVERLTDEDALGQGLLNVQIPIISNGAGPVYTGQDDYEQSGDED